MRKKPTERGDDLPEQDPIRVAVIGGGCASMAAAFELSRPEHKGKYRVTVYQLGWRLGGKGASGRGPADRIEEHGLHLWMGSYENAFRLIRECYAELKRDRRKCRIADWRDAFSPAPFIGLAERTRDGSYWNFLSYFPPGDGLPGDPLGENDPFTVTSYLARTASILRTLLLAVQAGRSRRTSPRAGREHPNLRRTHQREPDNNEASSDPSQRFARLLGLGWIATTAGLIEAVEMLEIVFAPRSIYPVNGIVELLEVIAASARRQLEAIVENDPELLVLWQGIDLAMASMRGILRFGLVSDPRGFDAINDYDFREWLRINGASERSIQSPLIRGAYDLVFAYEDGDYQRPRHGAGVALRGALRMLFSSRGAIFWKMNAGMGDTVFAPMYEVLKKRGVAFRFFHRLERVTLAAPDELAEGERAYVKALEFDVQAKVKNGKAYEPLIDVGGLPCWPSKPDCSQLIDGSRFEREEWDFESHWDKRKADTKTLRVVDDFDFVVLGVGLGAIPHMCQDLIQRDQRWRDMVAHLKTVNTQAFQIWLSADMEQLGWSDPPLALSAFVQPFETWADMSHLIGEERWKVRPGAIAYFCSALKDQVSPRELSDTNYPKRRRMEVRENGIRYLNNDIVQLWPNAVRRRGEFKWDLLIDPTEKASNRKGRRNNEARFDSQYWRANVNPTERYVLSLPGTQKYRISPLDNTYDNLTIAGDWTTCGLDAGCVEAAVISGRLAAHAISSSPALEDIVAYDHP
ncbi:MAG TPA: FAD-dependent oxidoreductase [Candidatus Binatus sp.]|uniref:FAD-dependent oxidoreductase n=1 Tax=Candidatus Binatus sp. TaxID=2811406 RepID=UPI002B481FAB|nr:FAD-dependent oxidoreductase [Candidatus Binatus sp.]HKN11553.1 FAD-dependent oxidoreductase [Candidatus Binatus sp.]